MNPVRDPEAAGRNPARQALDRSCVDRSCGSRPSSVAEERTLAEVSILGRYGSPLDTAGAERPAGGLRRIVLDGTSGAPQVSLSGPRNRRQPGKIEIETADRYG